MNVNIVPFPNTCLMSWGSEVNGFQASDMDQNQQPRKEYHQTLAVVCFRSKDLFTHPPLLYGLAVVLGILPNYGTFKIQSQ